MDLENIADSFQYLAHASGISLHMKELTTSDNTLSLANINAWIQNEKVAPDDVVLLYFSGHGSRVKSTSTIWPRGEFPEGPLEFSRIIEPLFAMKASLYIVLLDCCNDFATKSLKSKMKKRFDLSHLSSTHVVAGLKKLFLMPCGVIIASASSVGETAAALPRGGAFTTIFLRKFFGEIQSGSGTPQWENIFNTVRKKCQSTVYQTPQCKLFLKAFTQPPEKYTEYLFKRCRPK